MPLSATSEALARLRVSDLAAAAPCGPSLFEQKGFCKRRSRPGYKSGATGIGKLENRSRPKAISEVARLRSSLPEPDTENRAAVSIRSARPPIITVIGARRRALHGQRPERAATGLIVTTTQTGLDPRAGNSITFDDCQRYGCANQSGHAVAGARHEVVANSVQVNYDTSGTISSGGWQPVSAAL